MRSKLLAAALGLAAIIGALVADATLSPASTEVNGHVTTPRRLAQSLWWKARKRWTTRHEAFEAWLKTDQSRSLQPGQDVSRRVSFLEWKRRVAEARARKAKPRDSADQASDLSDREAPPGELTHSVRKASDQPGETCDDYFWTSCTQGCVPGAKFEPPVTVPTEVHGD